MGELCQREGCTNTTIKGGTIPINGKLYCQYHYNRITMGLDEE